MGKKQNNNAESSNNNESCYNGQKAISDWLNNKNNYSLLKVIAENSIFCSLKTYQTLAENLKTQNYSWNIPCLTITQRGQQEPSLICRRGDYIGIQARYKREKDKGPVFESINENPKAPEHCSKGNYCKLDGVRVYVDDNTIINRNFKELTGMTGCVNYTVCHIWDDVKVPEVFSAIANLVLLPSAIAGLSDSCQEVKEILQYRAYELFDWYPKYMPTPEKPKLYDKLQWKHYITGYTEKEKCSHITPTEHISLENRLTQLKNKKNSIIYQVINEVLQNNNNMSVEDLIKFIKKVGKSPDLIIYSLASDDKNCFGRVLEYFDNNKKIRIAEDYQEKIEEFVK